MSACLVTSMRVSWRGLRGILYLTHPSSSSTGSSSVRMPASIIRWYSSTVKRRRKALAGGRAGGSRVGVVVCVMLVLPGSGSAQDRQAQAAALGVGPPGAAVRRLLAVPLLDLFH